MNRIPRVRWPYLADGLDQQGRMEPGRRLTAADLDAAQAERDRAWLELLRSRGAITRGDEPTVHVEREPSVWRAAWADFLDLIAPLWRRRTER